MYCNAQKACIAFGRYTNAAADVPSLPLMKEFSSNGCAGSSGKGPMSWFEISRCESTVFRHKRGHYTSRRATSLDLHLAPNGNSFDMMMYIHLAQSKIPGTKDSMSSNSGCMQYSKRRLTWVSCRYLSELGSSYRQEHEEVIKERLTLYPVRG